LSAGVFVLDGGNIFLFVVIGACWHVDWNCRERKWEIERECESEGLIGFLGLYKKMKKRRRWWVWLYTAIKCCKITQSFGLIGGWLTRVFYYSRK
jgi:hypothetical protein